MCGMWALVVAVRCVPSARWGRSCCVGTGGGWCVCGPWCALCSVWWRTARGSRVRRTDSAVASLALLSYRLGHGSRARCEGVGVAGAGRDGAGVCCVVALFVAPARGRLGSTVGVDHGSRVVDGRCSACLADDGVGLRWCRRSGRCRRARCRGVRG